MDIYIPPPIEIVKSRIEEIVPQLAQHALKIIQYLIEYCDYQHMIRLAFSTDDQIKNTIFKILKNINEITYFFMSSLKLKDNNDHNTFECLTPYQGSDWTSNNMYLRSCLNVHTERQHCPLKFEGDNLDSNLYNNTNYIRAPGRSSTILIQFHPKVCRYFKRGFCKYGNNCKFFHGQEYDRNGINWRENELENDLIDLLRSKSGAPISIALLPTAYYKRFHRTLQGEVYVTESQRQDIGGCNLTMLLGQLKKIRVIERFDGQHYVILAKDTSNELNERKIYFTFPAESVLSKIDVSNYFNKYGDVHDVRIPARQEKRDYGYVTFVDSNTASKVLSIEIPHIICGTHIRVKPYKEKSGLNERKHREKTQCAMSYKSDHFNGDFDVQALSGGNSHQSVERQKSTLDESKEFLVSNPFKFKFSIKDNFKIEDTNHIGQESNQALNHLIE